MTDDRLMKRSPLDGVTLPVGMREVPFLAQVSLRANPSDGGTIKRLAAVLGFTLPVSPNTVSGDLDRHALWLGPDEWLVVGRPDSEDRLERSCRDALGGTTSAVVDVSANRTVVEIAGPQAREVLEAGCTIDLHPRAFGPGSCAQTLIARTGVILHQVSDQPVYRLFVRPSFALYLATWLADAPAGARRSL